MGTQTPLCLSTSLLPHLLQGPRPWEDLPMVPVMSPGVLLASCCSLVPSPSRLSRKKRATEENHSGPRKGRRPCSTHPWKVISCPNHNTISLWLSPTYCPSSLLLLHSELVLVKSLCAFRPRAKLCQLQCKLCLKEAPSQIISCYPKPRGVWQQLFRLACVIKSNQLL